MSRSEEPLLLIPGPTNISKKVREAMAQPQIGHLSNEFHDAFLEILKLSRYVFKNERGFQFAFSGSGTIGMESAVVNAVEPGDRTLVVDTGYFGKRFVILNQAHGARLDVIEYAEGRHADPDDLRKKLRQNKYKVVFITHVDTSTSVRNPVPELVEECQKAGVFSVVDSVCGIGGEKLDFDRLGADIAFTASQKALAGAPGAVMIAASEAIMDHFEKRKSPIASYYMNLMRWKPVMEDPHMYLATPSVQVLLGLRQALRETKEEGLEHRLARHSALGDLTRATLGRLGLSLVAGEGYRANTVTSVWVKEGTAEAIQKTLEAEHHIEIARGIGSDKDKMLRIGHFGNLTVEKLGKALAELEEVIIEKGAANGRSVQFARTK